MKIAIDVSILDKTKTGTAVYVLELVNGLKEILPSDVDLVLFRGPRSVKRRNILTTIVNGLIQVYWLNIKIPLLIYKHKIDIIHFPSNIIPFFSFCKTIVTILDANFMREPETYDYWWRKYGLVQYINSARVAERIITISDFSKNDIVKYFHGKEEKITKIYLGCRNLPTSPINLCSRLDSDYGKYALFVGGAFPSKNLPRLIRAFSGISELNLVITGGEGSDIKNVIKLAEEANKTCVRIFILGYVANEELDLLYRNANIFVFPSLIEGFGLPPLEAMKYGIPVVSSNAGSLPEILGQAAYYFDPLSEDEISKSVNIVSRDDNLRKELIENGYERVKQFSWNKCAKYHLDEYIRVFNDDFK